MANKLRQKRQSKKGWSKYEILVLILATFQLIISLIDLIFKQLRAPDKDM